MHTKLYIKNMVCDRCKMAVRGELDALRLTPLNVELGYAEFAENLTPELRSELSARLTRLGFEILDDKRSQIIEQIKKEVIRTVHAEENQLKTNFSDHLSSVLNRDYNSLSKLFSEVEGVTIEKYLIQQKVERIKELLVYNELSLSEIAFKLGYSSVAHLSNQFKKVTGLTPSFFKTMPLQERKPLDQV